MSNEYKPARDSLLDQPSLQVANAGLRVFPIGKKISGFSESAGKHARKNLCTPRRRQLVIKILLLKLNTLEQKIKDWVSQCARQGSIGVCAFGCRRYRGGFHACEFGADAVGEVSTPVDWVPMPSGRFPRLWIGCRRRRGGFYACGFGADAVGRVSTPVDVVPMPSGRFLRLWMWCRHCRGRFPHLWMWCRCTVFDLSGD